uniref:CBM39 domain-containing protein n=1 Tax=Anopheles farauti TaxID=69004 RepID=A0A182QES4_9DIPT
MNTMCKPRTTTVTMSRVFYFGLCALLVVLAISGEACGHGRHGRGRQDHHHRHHHGHHHHPPSLVVNLVMYDPKGMEVSIPRPNSTAQYFAVQMTINNPFGTTPDVSLNTTDLVYGKFIVRDTEVILKPGDFLNTTYQVGFADGGVTRYNTKLVVHKYMIQRNCSCSDGTTSAGTTIQRPVLTVPPWFRRTTVPTPPRFVPTTPASTTTTTAEPITGSWNEEQMDYSSEVFDCEIDPMTNRCTTSSTIDERFGPADQQPRAAKLVVQSEREPELANLRNIFTMVNGQCVTKPRSNYVTLKHPYRVFRTVDEVEEYVRSYLKQSPKLAKLAETGVQSAVPSGEGIVFEMDTLINKLQVLYFAQEGGLTEVKDYD